MSKNFFQQTPAPSKPAELIPEGQDMNVLTDRITRETAILQAEGEANRRAWAEEQVALRIKAQREDDAAARENARKEADRAAKAQLRVDEASRLEVGRQLRLKRRLVDLTGECAAVQSLLDAIDDKNAFEITHFKSTIAAVNKLMNPS